MFPGIANSAHLAAVWRVMDSALCPRRQMLMEPAGGTVLFEPKDVT